MVGGAILVGLLLSFSQILILLSFISSWSIFLLLFFSSVFDVFCLSFIWVLDPFLVSSHVTNFSVTFARLKGVYFSFLNLAFLVLSGCTFLL